MSKDGRERKWSRGADRSEISDGRKALFYGGFVVSGIGFLMFLSTFLLMAQGSSGLPGISGGPSFGDFAGRALGGMALIAIGQLMRSVGQRGVAGSGLILDPKRARREVEPWSRMAGGMLKDGLDEAGIELGSRQAEEPDFAERLRQLKALHDEGILTDDEYAREKSEVLERN